MKYHINANGDVKPCNATQRACRYGGEQSHYSTLEDAQQAYEDRMADEAIVSLRKRLLEPVDETEEEIDLKAYLANFDEDSLRDPTDEKLRSNFGGHELHETNSTNPIVNKLRAAALNAYEVQDEPVTWFHDSKKAVAAGSIRDIRDEEGDGWRHKPDGGLWLSPGHKKNGKVYTHWGNSSTKMWGSRRGSSITQEITLRPDAVILQLDDDCMDKLTELELTEEDEFFGSPKINWRKLKESGVDVIRVDGYRSNVFITWDLDSMVVLSGDSVLSTNVVDAAVPGDDYDDFNANEPYI